MILLFATPACGGVPGLAEFPLKIQDSRYPTSGRSSLTNYEKDHHYFLNRFVCVGEFFDG